MSSVGAALTLVAVLLWLGMVIAISFLEAPLKFTAPGVTLAIGLGIGRRVFRALNAVEAVLGVIAVAGIVLTFAAGNHGPTAIWVGTVSAIACLAAQVVGVRPALNRRSDEVLAGDGTTAQDRRSTAHFYYGGLELVKMVALIVAAMALLLHG